MAVLVHFSDLLNFGDNCILHTKVQNWLLAKQIFAIERCYFATCMLLSFNSMLFINTIIYAILLQ